MAKTILVVDDEPDILKLVKARLESDGYRVLTAIDGEEALLKVHTEKPDLIVLDIMLPKINGYDVCLNIKDDKNYKDIPIIILTVKFHPDDIRFAKALGADVYLTKPFEHDVLLENIQTLLKEKK